MQETCKNCFGSKKRSTTLLQEKTGKHECRNLTATYISALVLICFRLKQGRATFFRPETIVANFLFLMVSPFKVLVNHSAKRQFLVLHCRLTADVVCSNNFQCDCKCALTTPSRLIYLRLEFHLYTIMINIDKCNIIVKC